MILARDGDFPFHMLDPATDHGIPPPLGSSVSGPSVADASSSVNLGPAGSRLSVILGSANGINSHPPPLSIELGPDPTDLPGSIDSSSYGNGSGSSRNPDMLSNYSGWSSAVAHRKVKARKAEIITSNSTKQDVAIQTVNSDQDLAAQEVLLIYWAEVRSHIYISIILLKLSVTSGQFRAYCSSHPGLSKLPSMVTSLHARSCS